MSLEILWFIGHAIAAALCFLAGVHFARWRFVAAALKLRHERDRLARMSGVVFIDPNSSKGNPWRN
jgi:hypothetical protein